MYYLSMASLATSERTVRIGSDSADAFEHGMIRSEEQLAARLLTAEQLADRWQVSKAQVYRLARDSRIPTVAIGRYYRFRVSAIEAWEASQEVEAL
jgi:excisionase family DNA binding protein